MHQATPLQLTVLVENCVCLQTKKYLPKYELVSDQI